MAKRRMGIIAVILCFYLMSCTALASYTTDAKTNIQTNRYCALNVSYQCDGVAFSGQSVNLYKIADVSANAKYTLAPSFAASGVILNGVRSNGEWNVILSTLESYILANSIVPLMTEITNDSGEVRFAGLMPGLYMVSSVSGTQDNLTYSFGSALTALPGLGTDGDWQYWISIAAKPEVLPPIVPDENIQFKIVKLWKGDEGRTDRPSRIEVEIFRDGIIFETVVLSESNHWSYDWTAKNDGARWKVTERNIPKGYMMTLEERGTTFVLTNSLIQDESKIPPIVNSQTGDTSNILLYTVLMFLSGSILIILGTKRKRNRHEETN